MTICRGGIPKEDSRGVDPRALTPDSRPWLSTGGDLVREHGQSRGTHLDMADLHVVFRYLKLAAVWERAVERHVRARLPGS